MSHLHVAREAMGWVFLVCLIAFLSLWGGWPCFISALRFVLEAMNNV